MKIFLCTAGQILIIRNIFPPWEQIKIFPIQQSFEKSLHSANCQRCVKATLTLLLIYFRGIIRVIMKIEMREIKFSWGVIAWDFLLIFYFIKIESKWLGKVSFRAKNQKDMLDDGTYSFGYLPHKSETCHFCCLVATFFLCLTCSVSPSV